MTSAIDLYNSGKDPFMSYWEAYSLTKDEMIETLQDADDCGEWIGWTDPKKAARGIIELCIGWDDWNDDDDESRPSFGGNDPYYECCYFPKDMEEVERTDGEDTYVDIYDPMEDLADKDPVELDGDNIIEWVKALPFNKLVLKCGYDLWLEDDDGVYSDPDDLEYLQPYYFLIVR